MKTKKSLTSYLPKTGAIYGIILFLLVFSLSVDNYTSINNFTNIARQAAVLCILTICAFLAILTHQLDLSIGGICGLTGMVVAVLLEKQAPLPVACLAGLATGVAFGMVNGLLAGMTTIPTFIVTLATMNIAESLGMVIRTGTIQITNSTFVWLSNGSIGPIPFPLLLVAVIYLIFWYILKYRPYGTRLYAVGGKEEAALTAGINVKRTKVSVYLINGFLSGLAGILMASRLSSANPSAAMGYELDAICGTVLGGTALTGGRGQNRRRVLGRHRNLHAPQRYEYDGPAAGHPKDGHRRRADYHSGRRRFEKGVETGKMSESLRKKLTFMAKYSYVFILLLIFLIMSFATDKFFDGGQPPQCGPSVLHAADHGAGYDHGNAAGPRRGHVPGRNRIHFFLFRGRLLPPKPRLGIHSAGHPVGIAIGALAGVVNGVLISYLHLPAMLVTYGVREILRGVAYAYMNGGVITSIHPAIRFIGSGRIFGVIPTQIVIALFFTLLAVFLLKCTRMGRELYITGANPAAARFSGIKVDKNIIIGFVCSGVMAAIAGIIYVGRLGAAEAEIGTDFHFRAISAAAIGGISFNGGVGSPWGVVTGALILTLLNNAQNLLQISSARQGFIYGATIIVAVLLDFFVRSQQTK